jgi:hypothetical protein
MGNTIPDAAAMLSAAHHRARQQNNRRTKSAPKTSVGRSMFVRIAIVAVILAGLIGGVNAVMLRVLG